MWVVRVLCVKTAASFPSNHNKLIKRGTVKLCRRNSFFALHTTARRLVHAQALKSFSVPAESDGKWRGPRKSGLHWKPFVPCNGVVYSLSLDGSRTRVSLNGRTLVARKGVGSQRRKGQEHAGGLADNCVSTHPVAPSKTEMQHKEEQQAARSAANEQRGAM